MKHKLLSYYGNALEQNILPTTSQLTTHYWFSITNNDGWIGIAKEEVDLTQLDLLQSLFDFYQPEVRYRKEESIWSQYLFFHGNIPETKENDTYRIIQFHMNSNDLERELIETAFKGFIYEDSLLIWNSNNQGIVLEKNNHYVEDEDYASLAEALQSDFYFTTTFYLGKELKVNENMASIFAQERIFFSKGISLLSNQRVLSLEKILPHLLVDRLVEAEVELFQQWFSILEEDQELLMTIQTFIENNGHSTKTAKQLYIHRNTLQYRLDKFTEKTGFLLKDYNSFFIIYLACLYFNHHGSGKDKVIL